MSTQSDAINRVRVSERRYNVSRLIILLLAMATLVAYIGYQASHAIKEVKTDNAEKLAKLEKKIDDSSDAQRRFNCSLAIQLTHSDQSVDDCVKTNKLAENSLSTPQNTAPQSSPSAGSGSASSVSPSTTAADTSGQPATAPNPPQQNVIQRTLNNIQGAVRGLFN